ncbi:MAG: hypothetical protein NW220_19725 [Leptolyngbyaceae cyanobacterium bins.349]|nr:hypothetical protein [Leptolyngbyaceae cyanobacterium bins.349]
MESDSTTWEESPKILLAREVVNILNQAMHKIDENDYFSAQIMVGVALHHLESLQIDLTEHLSLERTLRSFLKHP